jgi:hypothetical protein
MRNGIEYRENEAKIASYKKNGYTFYNVYHWENDEYIPSRCNPFDYLWAARQEADTREFSKGYNPNWKEDKCKSSESI